MDEANSSLYEGTVVNFGVIEGSVDNSSDGDIDCEGLGDGANDFDSAEEKEVYVGATDNDAVSDGASDGADDGLDDGLYDGLYDGSDGELLDDDCDSSVMRATRRGTGASFSLLSGDEPGTRELLLSRDTEAWNVGSNVGLDATSGEERDTVHLFRTLASSCASRC